MGKKGKRAAKAKEDTGAKPKSTGRARRERAAAQREIDAKLDVFIARLEVELADRDLFSPIAEMEDCPICLVPLPFDHGKHTFMPCCGKTICCGCTHKHNMVARSVDVPCEFCRADAFMEPQKIADAMQKLVDGGSVHAVSSLGVLYAEVAKGKMVGMGGNLIVANLDQRAVELHLEAAERGHFGSVFDLAKLFREGTLVKKDSAKAEKLAVAAAKLGDLQAHFLLGDMYVEDGCPLHLLPETSRSHFIFAARNGDSRAMNIIRNLRQTDNICEGDFDEIDDAFKEAAKIQWTEEREAYASLLSGNRIE